MSHKASLVLQKATLRSVETEFSPLISKYDNQTLSIIIRCHKQERLKFLDEALFSLANQYWQNIEIVVVIQNGNAEFRNAVNELIKKQPFSEGCKFQIHSVKIPEGVDGRSALLNVGIKSSTGRYLAFLDDDDVVYQHGYKTLISQINKENSPVAVGGCRVARLKKESGNWHIETKETPFSWGRNRFDLYKNNFVTIHSYIIDRTKVDSKDLYFDEKMHLLEDYDFLLRLNAKYEFDFSKLDVFVCEYRMHGDNSLPYHSEASPEIPEIHLKALEIITERKKYLNCSIPVAQLINLLEKETVSVQTYEAAPIELTVVDVNSGNLRVFKRVLNTTEEKVYNFFKNRPKLEKRLSNMARLGWTFYTKYKLRGVNNQA